MAQPTYEDGYKQGVGDALFILDEEASLPRSTTAYIRKKLLTKKVTKWANVWGSETNARVGQTALYDSKEYAKGVVNFSDDLSIYLGTYPIEIEVPL